MKRMLKSFGCALRGIGLSFGEPHMRFHLVAAGYVLYFSLFYSFGRAEYSALFAVIGMVMGAECLNTAVENLSDRVTRETDPMIRRAKDISAGAVLICAIFAAAVGVCLFWDVEVFQTIWTYFTTDLTHLIPLGASVGVCTLFVMGKLYRRKETKNHGEN